MIGVFPLTNQVRERIKRQKSGDESGGWDSCEPPPVAEVVRLHSFDNQGSPKADRLQAAAPHDSARNDGDGLLVPTHLHLDETPLVDTQISGGLACQTAEERGGQIVALRSGP
jgi:hypothetical protein